MMVKRGSRWRDIFEEPSHSDAFRFRKNGTRGPGDEAVEEGSEVRILDGTRGERTQKRFESV